MSFFERVHEAILLDKLDQVTDELVDLHPFVAGQEVSGPRCLENCVDKELSDFNFGANLMDFFARHVLVHLGEYLGVVFSRVFCLEALFFEYILDLHHISEDFEVDSKIVSLDLGHEVNSGLCISSSLLCIGASIRILVVSLLLLLLLLLVCKLIEQLNEVFWHGLSLDPLPAALRWRHLLTVLPDEGVLLPERGTDLLAVAVVSLGIYVVVIVALLLIVLLVVVLILLIAAIFFVLGLLFGTSSTSSILIVFLLFFFLFLFFLVIIILIIGVLLLLLG